MGNEGGVADLQGDQPSSSLFPTECVSGIQGGEEENGGMKSHFRPREPNVMEAKARDEIRAEANRFMKAIEVYCPDGREKSIAVQKIEEGVLWALESVFKEPPRVMLDKQMNENPGVV